MMGWVEDLAVKHGILVERGKEGMVELELAVALQGHQLLRQLVDGDSSQHRLRMDHEALIPFRYGAALLVGYLNVGVNEIISADSETIEVAGVHQEQSIRLRAPGVVIELERQIGAKVVPRGLAGRKVLMYVCEQQAALLSSMDEIVRWVEAYELGANK